MRQTFHQPPIWAALICAALLALAWVQFIFAAPAPFSRDQGDRWHRPRLVGTWVLHWQGSRGIATFSPDGGYHCRWHGVEFVGKWNVAGGRIWIKESCRPGVKDSWHTFSVPLTPLTEGAPLSETGLMRSH